MRLEQLKIFVSAAETHSMTQTAEQLYTTVQNVSKSIKELEMELNVPLFNRTKHGIFLTADGEIVYSHIKEVQNHIDAVQQKYSSNLVLPKEPLTGSLRILSCPAMNSFINNIIMFLRQHYPHLSISHINEEAHVINQNIKDDKYAEHDIVISSVDNNTLHEYEMLSKKCRVYFLRKDSIKVHVSKSHPLAQYEQIPLNKLFTYPMVMYSISNSYNTPSTLLSILERSASLKLVPALTTNSQTQCDTLIEEGLYYGLIGSNDEGKAERSSSTIIIPLKEKLYLSYLMFIPNKEQYNEQIDIFQKKILNKFKETYRRLY